MPKKIPVNQSNIIDYKASPTGALFHQSKAFVRGIMGPIGSGKSVACCLEIFRRAQEQAKSSDGKRRTRWVVIRNTAPELETTTIKTWLDWFPEASFGKMNRKPPLTHHVSVGDIELEVIFLALDRPDDVKKLMSLEVTGIWINEARYIQQQIIDNATGRVGRYPAMKEKPAIHKGQWPTWKGIIMDTNPPTDDHWWYKMAEEKAWAVDFNGDKVDPETVSVDRRWEFFKQPSGLSSNAENLRNLTKNYYYNMLSGKKKEWINVYVHGNYGYVQDGKPVYGEYYNDDVHCLENVKPEGLSPLVIGVDFGNTPAAAIGQMTTQGQIIVLAEFAAERSSVISLRQFAKMLKTVIVRDFNNFQISLFGDPAGGAIDSHTGSTTFDIFRQEGLLIRPAPTNNVQMRIESVLQPLMRMVNGKPAFILNKSCKLLRRGFNGGYKYKKLNTSGEIRFHSIPEKDDKFSHIHDALQYMCCGMGEYKKLVRGMQSDKKTVIRKSFSVWS